LGLVLVDLEGMLRQEDFRQADQEEEQDMQAKEDLEVREVREGMDSEALDRVYRPWFRLVVRRSWCLPPSWRLLLHRL
jgi:hypothetical protein